MSPTAERSWILDEVLKLRSKNWLRTRIPDWISDWHFEYGVKYSVSAELQNIGIREEKYLWVIYSINISLWEQDYIFKLTITRVFPNLIFRVPIDRMQTVSLGKIFHGLKDLSGKFCWFLDIHKSLTLSLSGTLASHIYFYTHIRILRWVKKEKS